jgi:hypothetical protein
MWNIALYGLGNEFIEVSMSISSDRSERFVMFELPDGYKLMASRNFSEGTRFGNERYQSIDKAVIDESLSFADSFIRFPTVSFPGISFPRHQKFHLCFSRR